MRRRSFLGSGLYSLFMPIIGRPEAPDQQPPTEAIYLAVPSFVNTLNLTNPQAYQSRNGVIFAATRADSSIGGVVWRVDGYVDRDHAGTITQVFPTDPAKYFANGELVIWPDGYLYFVTIEVDNIRDRNILAQVIYPVPGWVP